MIECQFCHKEHEQESDKDIYCDCGAHGFILKQDRNRGWFWSRTPAPDVETLTPQNPVLDKETWLKYMSHK